jgi:hypothetical protein
MIWLNGSGEVENVKVRQMDRQTTDNEWSEKLTWATGTALYGYNNKKSEIAI